MHSPTRTKTQAIPTATSNLQATPGTRKLRTEPGLSTQITLIMYTRRTACRKPNLSILASAFLMGLALAGRAATPIPSPEKLLPDDTLIMVTAPDFGRVRQILKASPQS